jgi:ribonuclease R
VIHSHARLTYTDVGAVLADGESPNVAAERYGDIARLYRLYDVLRAAREQRGALDFDTQETRIVFDEQRKIAAIEPVYRNDAHKLIEECMLIANVATARFLEATEQPALFRVHEGPSAQKLENLRAFLGELTLELPGGLKPTPEHYQSLLSAVEGRDDAQVIQTMLLRSLSQAVYQPDNGGHFGLHFEAYAHFTSPIRRYPDLLVHRAIRSVIRGRSKSAHVNRVPGAKGLRREVIYPYDMAGMLALGEQCSMTERRADDATREVDAWLKCEFLKDRIGDAFSGVIAAVTNFGVFVELHDLYIEGLLHVSALPADYYHFDQAKQRLVGERTRQVFQLGGVVAVKVARVDLDDRKIDLELVDGASPKRPAGAGARQQGKGDKKQKSGGEGPKKARQARRKTSSKNPSKVASSKSASSKTQSNKNTSSQAKSGKASLDRAKVKDGGATKKPKGRKKTGKSAAAKSSKRASSSRKER